MQPRTTPKTADELMHDIRELRDRIDRFAQEMEEERQVLREQLQQQREEFERLRKARAPEE